MKKKIFYISIILIVLTLLSVNTINKKYIDKNNKETSNKSLAIYIENDNGEFIKSTSIPSKGSGYTFNTLNSVCDGNATISWDNEIWGLELDNIDRADTKCYLYFSK